MALWLFIAVGTCIATPVSLGIIWATENGDNPFRDGRSIVKCGLIWAFVFLVAAHRDVGRLGFVVFIPFVLALGLLFHLAFRQGFLRGLWWSLLSFGALFGIAITLFAIQSLLVFA